jgi:hypothetical protein
MILFLKLCSIKLGSQVFNSVVLKVFSRTGNHGKGDKSHISILKETSPFLVS